MNIVVIGHVDHGKSTLIGRLLYDSKQLADGKVSEVQKLVDSYKRKFEFAYFIDAFGEEVEQERTIDTTRIRFRTDKREYIITDVPGHKEFIKNMLTGASQADAAILVVDIMEGIKEQTKRHLFLANLLGIKTLIVLVNKMDLVNYEKEPFQKALTELEPLIKSYNFSLYFIIPGSAYIGENILKPSEKMLWWTGPNLGQVLDNLEDKEVKKRPFRFLVQGVYKYKLVGKVISGSIKIGEELEFQPSGAKANLESITAYGYDVEEASKGMSIGLNLNCNYIPRGDVGFKLGEAISPVEEILGELTLTSGLIKIGSKLSIKCGTKTSKCIVKDITSKISTETGEVLIEGDCKEIKPNETATTILKVNPMIVEKFSEMPELGRFIVTQANKNIGLGIVL